MIRLADTKTKQLINLQTQKLGYIIEIKIQNILLAIRQVNPIKQKFSRRGPGTPRVSMIRLGGA